MPTGRGGHGTLGIPDLSMPRLTSYGRVSCASRSASCFNSLSISCACNRQLPSWPVRSLSPLLYAISLPVCLSERVLTVPGHMYVISASYDSRKLTTTSPSGSISGFLSDREKGCLPSVEESDPGGSRPGALSGGRGSVGSRRRVAIISSSTAILSTTSPDRRIWLPSLWPMATAARVCVLQP